MLGWANPLPMTVGGEPSPTEQIYSALREAVGIGGSADDDSGLDGLLRAADATVLAAAASGSDRAVANGFPALATDLLRYWERLLLSPLTEDAALEHRQAEVSRLLTERVRNNEATLSERLSALDSRLSLSVPNYAQATVTVPGRAFEDRAGLQPFGGLRRSTAVPNYSSAFVQTLVFDVGAGVVPTTAEQRTLREAVDYLNSVLAAWTIVQVVTSTGFTLDTDLLDLTALSP